MKLPPLHVQQLEPKSHPLYIYSKLKISLYSHQKFPQIFRRLQLHFTETPVLHRFVVGICKQMRGYSDIRKKQPPWAVVRKRTISTERQPLVGEVSDNFLRIEGVAWSEQRIPTAVNFGFLDRHRYFSIPQLSSRG
jgi:hypothetical protein